MPFIYKLALLLVVVFFVSCNGSSGGPGSASEPVTNPILEDEVVDESGSDDSGTDESDTDDSDTDESDTDDSDTDESDTDDSGTDESDTDDSDTDDSDTDDSDTDESGTDESGTDDSGTDDSGTDDSGTDDSGSDDSGTDDSGTDDSGTDDSGTDDSGTDESDTDESDTDESDTDESDTDESGTDESGTDDSGSDDSGTDESGTDDSGTDDSGSDDSGTDDSGTDDSGTDDSGTDDSGTDDSGTDESGTDDSGTDDSGTDDSGTDDSGTDDSGTDDSGTDDSGTDDSGADDSSTEDSVIDDPVTPPPASNFTNPLFSDGADPWLQWFEGNYYLTTTTGSSQLVMRKSPTLAGLADATPQYIWSDTISNRALTFWAFEFHRLEGPNGFRWYVMYTSGDGTQWGQRLHVLESAGDDPMGPYEFKNTLIPDPWNIDGTYLTHNDQLYLLWSQFIDDDQSIWIAEMKNPWTVDEGTTMLLTRPEFIWEYGLRENESGNVGRVNEAPEILQHGSRTYMVYSANTCDGPNYKLGLMELVGDDPLEISDWVKNQEPVFEQGNDVFGPGHNGFFTSPDGSEDWLVYHGNALSSEGCSDTRSVRAQKITYDANDFPIFGQPAAAGELLSSPSGETNPQIVIPEGMSYRLANQSMDYCVVNGETNAQAAFVLCSSTSDSWVLDYANDGYYRLANSETGEFLKSHNCASSNPTATVITGSWESTNDCALWSVTPTQNGFVSLTNKNEAARLSCDSTNTELAFNDASDEPCDHWRLEPVDEFAITSIVSGKVFQAEACSSDSGSSIKQSQWNGSSCQRWTAQPVSDGYFEFSSNINSSTCMQLTGDVANPGADIIQGDCGTTTALWAIEPLADGTLKLSSASSGHVVDLDRCLLDDRINIGQWEWLDNECQRFTFKSTASAPVSDVDSFLWPLTGDLAAFDPTLEIENNVWYEFHAGTGIQAKISNDGGLSWQQRDQVLDSALTWWTDEVPDFDTANNDVWAPDAQIYNGKVWLYYAITTFGSQTSAIGLLSSDSLAAGNWVDEGLVISSSDSVDFNAIDPNLIIDSNDEPWLVFGSWWTGIKITKLDKTTMKPTGDITALAANGGGIEEASLMYRDGYYYLFVSVGTCCDGLNSSYQIRYGRSASITGPYLDKDGLEMLNAGGTQLWTGNSRWVGPGGQDIHSGSVMIFHAYDGLDNGDAKLNIAEIKWDNNGWPYLTDN